MNTILHESVTGDDQEGFTNIAKALASIAEVEMFVAWKPGTPDPRTGKFSKRPIDAAGAYLTGWQKPENHLTLDAAVARAIKFANLKAGIGAAFTGEAIAEDGRGGDLWLVAVDLDGVVVKGELTPYARRIVDQMASYAEISPSGKGVRILAFSHEPLRSCKARKEVIDGVETGREIFASGGFVTLTGNVINAVAVQVRTAALKELTEAWGGRRAVSQQPRPDIDVKGNMDDATRRREVKRLEDAVAWIDTTGYDDFVSVMKALACVVPGVGLDEAIRLAELAANNAPAEARTNNNRDGTNPAAMVMRAGRGSVDDGFARLMKRARQGAVRAVLAEAGRRRISNQVVAAMAYLEKHAPNVAGAVRVAMEAAL